MVLAGFVGGFGWFWVVLGGFGWFRVLVTTIFRSAERTDKHSLLTQKHKTQLANRDLSSLVPLYGGPVVS